MNTTDTIAAPASAVGGAVTVIRISGPEAAAVLKNDLTEMKRSLDVNEVGGTALIGISMPVIKAHGSSNAASFFAAIRQAKQFAESGIIDDIAANVDAMRVKTEQP